MNRLDHDRVMGILAEAMELPEPRRVGFLDSTCLGEPGLRRRIDELLQFAPRAAEVFDVAADTGFRGDPNQIGPYADLELIGEGGMAVVYRARQTHPVKRIVAIKLIKLGMDTRQFVLRFEAERQALALMDHPSVARVFDAGATETGRPYFVMEYVAGQPILQYCDAKKLDTRGRLDLFTMVCEAVEHAHRKGILHRDIKSSNVLVTDVDGKPIPKVIDFGVAKALQQPLTDRTLQTELGQLIGTPEYMSPEQAELGALGVDTRSDVYSLGVLLYELIGGVQPISSDMLRGGSYAQVQQIIREREPPRPSTRLNAIAEVERSGIAESRQTSVAALIRELRSELEWIPLKAIRKDREQRYRSAAELADDIRNYLDGRPLLAGPESGWYRARKFLRRHKTGVAASVAMLLLLVAGIIATTWQAVRATRAEVRAVQERDSAKAMFDFLTDDVLAGASPENIPDAKVRDQIVNAMITPASRTVGGKFKDRPLIEAGVREAIQSVLRQVGRSDLALPHAELALSIRRRELGDDHVDTIASLSDYALGLQALGNWADAEPLLKDVLVRRRRLLGENNPETITSLFNYAFVLDMVGKSDAEPVYGEALQRRRNVLGNDHPDTIRAMSAYALVLYGRGRADDAEALSREALERSNSALGEDHPQAIRLLHSYALLLELLKRSPEAEPLARQALERRRRVLGEDHPDTIRSMSTYAKILRSLGRLAEAESMFSSVHDRFRRVLGDDHANTIVALDDWARILLKMNQPEKAEPFARQAVANAVKQPSMGHEHDLTKSFAANHADCLDALGRRDEAAAVRQAFSLPNPTTRP